MPLMGGAIQDATTGAGLPFCSIGPAGQLYQWYTDGNGIWNNLSDGAVSGYSGIVLGVYCSGYNPLQFTMSHTATFPGGAVGLWEVVRLTRAPQPQPTCCFVGDTPVLLADGTTAPIAEIEEGAYVLGRDGAVNRVIGVETPRLGARALHAINGGPAFFTAEHPFLTATGWAAVDTGAARGEGFDEELATLAPGSLLQRVVGADAAIPAGSIATRARLRVVDVPVVRIDTAYAAPGTVVHNLLLEGDHTYVAGGWLVHNKGSH
jgi:hypothetical protein